ncbi:unnamed protein product, partial [Polarella glacialis]
AAEEAAAAAKVAEEVAAAKAAEEAAAAAKVAEEVAAAKAAEEAAAAAKVAEEVAAAKAEEEAAAAAKVAEEVAAAKAEEEAAAAAKVAEEVVAAKAAEEAAAAAKVAEEVAAAKAEEEAAAAAKVAEEVAVAKAVAAAKVAEKAVAAKAEEKAAWGKFAETVAAVKAAIQAAPMARAVGEAVAAKVAEETAAEASLAEEAAAAKVAEEAAAARALEEAMLVQAADKAASEAATEEWVQRVPGEHEHECSPQSQGEDNLECSSQSQGEDIFETGEEWVATAVQEIGQNLDGVMVLDSSGISNVSWEFCDGDAELQTEDQLTGRRNSFPEVTEEFSANTSRSPQALPQTPPQRVQRPPVGLRTSCFAAPTVEDVGDEQVAGEEPLVGEEKLVAIAQPVVVLPERNDLSMPDSHPEITPQSRNFTEEVSTEGSDNNNNNKNNSSNNSNNKNNNSNINNNNNNSKLMVQAVATRALKAMLEARAAKTTRALADATAEADLAWLASAAEQAVVIANNNNDHDINNSNNANINNSSIKADPPYTSEEEAIAQDAEVDMASEEVVAEVTETVVEAPSTSVEVTETSVEVTETAVAVSTKTAEQEAFVEVAEMTTETAEEAEAEQQDTAAATASAHERAIAPSTTEEAAREVISPIEASPNAPQEEASNEERLPESSCTAPAAEEPAENNNGNNNNNNDNNIDNIDSVAGEAAATDSRATEGTIVAAALATAAASDTTESTAELLASAEPASADPDAVVESFQPPQDSQVEKTEEEEAITNAAAHLVALLHQPLVRRAGPCTPISTCRDGPEEEEEEEQANEAQADLDSRRSLDGELQAAEQRGPRTSLPAEGFVAEMVKQYSRPRLDVSFQAAEEPEVNEEVSQNPGDSLPPALPPPNTESYDFVQLPRKRSSISLSACISKKNISNNNSNNNNNNNNESAAVAAASGSAETAPGSGGIRPGASFSISLCTNEVLESGPVAPARGPVLKGLAGIAAQQAAAFAAGSPRSILTPGRRQSLLGTELAQPAFAGCVSASRGPAAARSSNFTTTSNFAYIQAGRISPDQRLSAESSVWLRASPLPGTRVMQSAEAEFGSDLTKSWSSPAQARQLSPATRVALVETLRARTPPPGYQSPRLVQQQQQPQPQQQQQPQQRQQQQPVQVRSPAAQEVSLSSPGSPGELAFRSNNAFGNACRPVSTSAARVQVPAAATVWRTADSNSARMVCQPVSAALNTSMLASRISIVSSEGRQASPSPAPVATPREVEQARGDSRPVTVADVLLKSPSSPAAPGNHSNSLNHSKSNLDASYLAAKDARALVSKPQSSVTRTYSADPFATKRAAALKATRSIAQMISTPRAPIARAQTPSQDTAPRGRTWEPMTRTMSPAPNVCRPVTPPPSTSRHLNPTPSTARHFSPTSSTATTPCASRPLTPNSSATRPFATVRSTAALSGHEPSPRRGTVVTVRGQQPVRSPSQPAQTSQEPKMSGIATPRQPLVQPPTMRASAVIQNQQRQLYDLQQQRLEQQRLSKKSPLGSPAWPCRE